MTATNGRSRPAGTAQLHNNNSQPTVYPRKIVLSEGAETYISALATALIVGKCSLHNLSPALLEFHTFAWNDGYHARDAELAALTATADRLYTEMCRRPAARPPIPHDQPTYAALENIRGASPERVAEIEATDAARKAEAFGDAA